jgi:hypothetical protein
MNRTAVNSVRTKIDGLISSFKIADEFALNTGQGIHENEGEERFAEYVKQWCAYYFDLLPVMQDRHSIRPSFTTDLDDSDSNESEDILNISLNSVAELSIISSTSGAAAGSGTEKHMASDKSKAPSVATKNDKVVSEKRKALALEARHKARSLAKISAQKKDNVTAALENIGISGGSVNHHDVYIAKKSEMMKKRLKRFDDKMDIAERRLHLDEKRFAHEVEQSTAKMNEARRRFNMEEMTFQLQHNKEVLRQRLDFKRNNPDVTEEELDSVFPFHRT